MKRPYLKHLKTSADLLTQYEATRAGFVRLALERNRRANPFIAQARALKTAASAAKAPADLLNIKNIQKSLLTAAGISDKAFKYFKEIDHHEAIEGLIEHYLEPAGENFIEELVFRFLLTRGDNLGGSMRNVGGFMAQTKLTRSIIAYLQLSRSSCRWLDSKTKLWVSLTNQDTDIELRLKGLSWGQGKSTRTLIYNRNVPLVDQNIDLCLLNCGPDKLLGKSLPEASLFLALGELKGGIDPAGADEHWKTARTALNRISTAFESKNYHPHIFFIGAAIVEKMSDQIWSMLQNKTIENAANLTDENQIASIAAWLCEL